MTESFCWHCLSIFCSCLNYTSHLLHLWVHHTVNYTIPPHMWVRSTVRNVNLPHLTFLSQVGPSPSSFCNKSTIRVDSLSYLSYTVLLSLFVTAEFSICGPTTSWKIYFWLVLAGKKSCTKTIQGLVVKLRCFFLASFLTGKPWSFIKFSRKHPHSIT